MTYKYQSNVDEVIEKVKEHAPEFHDQLLQLINDVVNVGGFPQEGLLFVYEEEPATEENEGSLILFLTYQGIDIVPGESYQDFLSKIEADVQVKVPEDSSTDVSASIPTGEQNEQAS